MKKFIPIVIQDSKNSFTIETEKELILLTKWFLGLATSNKQFIETLTESQKKNKISTEKIVKISVSENDSVPLDIKTLRAFFKLGMLNPNIKYSCFGSTSKKEMTLLKLFGEELLTNDSYQTVPPNLGVKTPKIGATVYSVNNGFEIVKNNKEIFKDLKDYIKNFSFSDAFVLKNGGRLSAFSKQTQEFFQKTDWEKEKNFLFYQFGKNGEYLDANNSHKVDLFKSLFALEIEWNSKDSVFDRDLTGFNILHQKNEIKAGIIITRSTKLQDLIYSDAKFKSVKKKFGASQTFEHKLMRKIQVGKAGQVPLLIICVHPVGCK